MKLRWRQDFIGFRILQPFCYTFPGLNQGLINSGAKEQLLILTRGIYGCLDGSLRSIIRNLALLVGKRNEHQRGDRDNFIAVNDGNIVVPVSQTLRMGATGWFKSIATTLTKCCWSANRATPIARSVLETLFLFFRNLALSVSKYFRCMRRGFSQTTTIAEKQAKNTKSSGGMHGDQPCDLVALAFRANAHSWTIS